MYCSTYLSRSDRSLYLQECLEFAAQGKVKAIIEEKKLEDINEIFDDMLKGEINGRIVVTI